MGVTLRRIDKHRWCAVDSRFPPNDARCLAGYVERLGQVYHAIRLDGAPATSYDEPDLMAIISDLERPRP
jgi:hypothetical protein